MDTIEAIKMRRSVRAYSDKKILDEELHQLLEAAMSGPSCVNAKDWTFLVVRDKTMLNKMARANGRAAEPLKNANIGILVCGDLNRSFKGAPEYWVIDCSIACQNLILAASALKIASVWLGTYPQMERVNALKMLFELPENIVPNSIIALGYPKDLEEMKLRSRRGYGESQVHYEYWEGRD